MNPVVRLFQVLSLGRGCRVRFEIVATAVRRELRDNYSI